MATVRMDTSAKASGRALRIAMICTLGLPSPDGGQEDAVEEVGRRLVDRGHAVTVFCRSVGGGRIERASDYLGMRLIRLPALPGRTLSPAGRPGSGMSVSAAVHDAAFLFNAATTPFVPWLRLRGIPTTVHVDAVDDPSHGWGAARSGYRRWAEHLSVQHAAALIADNQRTVDYYQDEYPIPIELISHGTRVLHDPPAHRLGELGLEPNGYHLVVARSAEDSQMDLIIDGYRHSGAHLPLAVVGTLPHSSGRRRSFTLADDSRVRLLGVVTDRDLLDQVYAHAVSSLHGQPVPGTDTSLLRAMGAGTAAIAWEASPHRDILGVYGAYYRDTTTLATLIEDAELHSHHTQEVSLGLQRRASALHNWGHITDRYEDLAQRLVSARALRETTVGC